MRGEEAAAWIALRGVPTIGDVAGRNLVEHFGSPRAVLAAAPADLVVAGLAASAARAVLAADLAAAETEVGRIVACGARVIAITDDEYPAPLRELPDAPLYVTVRGERLERGPALAVVGARHATPYGIDVATRFGEELAQAGISVVSGLARGIDGAAHRGALRGGGHTVAVLGSGVDVVYPPEHEALAAEIVRTGALVSERPVGTAPLPSHFPARNRIIAGMTHGTVVVEAAERSGSRITARLALDAGREVFAVPGRIDSPLSIGAHRLIQEGAKLVGSIDDVVGEIAPALRARGLDRTARAAQILPDGDALLPLLGAGPLRADELIRRSGLPASQVLTRILELELRGVLEQLPGNQVQLASRA
jgi:DNA processing protein